MYKKILALSLVLIMFAMPAPAKAQEQPAAANNETSVIYQTPSTKSLSKLYWAIGKLDISDNEAIDNYLMINECDIYNAYIKNEFEWKSIRESTRLFLEQNRKKLPTHFELLQPLRLAEYNTETGIFDVWDPYDVDSIQRFEMLAEDIFDQTCNKPHNHRIPGYPKGLYVEFNRPFTLKEFKADTVAARTYIEHINSKIKESGAVLRDKEYLYKVREAYLVMDVRLFSYKEEVRPIDHLLAKVLGILEGYRIYGDKERTILLFSEDFQREKQRSPLEIKMKQDYQERLRKHMQEEKEQRLKDAQE